MFEELSDKQRKLLKEALDAKADLCYDKKNFEKLGEVERMLSELHRIGRESDKTHDEGCPNLPFVAHVQSPISCTGCDSFGWHPTRVCDCCGYRLCWCVEDDNE